MKKFKFILPLFYICYFSSFQFAYSQQQLLNSDFENWVNDSLPADWSPPSQYDVYKTTDNYSGSYAMIVWKWYSYIEGSIVNGNISFSQTNDFIKGGEPISQKPTALNGFYKYLNPIRGVSGAQGDTMGIVIVILKKYNFTLQKRDTVGYAVHYLAPVDTFTAFTVTISDFMPGVIPDSIVVVFMSSMQNGITCPGNAVHCEELYIDGLSLSYSTGIEENYNKPADWLIYPNPAYGKLQISPKNNIKKNESISIKVFDLMGQEVKTNYQIVNNKIELDASTCASGIYYFTLQNGQQYIIGNGKFALMNY